MNVLLRLGACVALLGSCNVAFAGNFFGPTFCGPSFPDPRDVAGVYQHRDADRYVRLEIDPYGTAELRVFGASEKIPLAGGVVLMAGQTPSEDWPRDEFVFKGVACYSGDVISRRYKRHYNHEQDRSEIVDITDPDNPINLSPEEPPFPWTAAFVVSALIVGGLVGRYSARRGDAR
jgi:hypothetical protein